MDLIDKHFPFVKNIAEAVDYLETNEIPFDKNCEFNCESIRHTLKKYFLDFYTKFFSNIGMYYYEELTSHDTIDLSLYITNGHHDYYNTFLKNKIKKVINQFMSNFNREDFFVSVQSDGYHLYYEVCIGNDFNFITCNNNSPEVEPIITKNKIKI
jgi:hypothetical protein